MIEMHGDARQERSRQRLYEAILAVDAEAPISSVTAADVASRAGVGRATLYRHADSPHQLLLAALQSELDFLREGAYQGDLSDLDELQSKFAPTLLRVVSHVVRRVNVYGPALLSNESPAVAKMLIDHLHESVLELTVRLSKDAWQRILPTPDDIDPGLLREAAASGFAHLFVGVLTSWLRRGGVYDTHEFLSVFNTLAPRWWLQSSGAMPHHNDEKTTTGQ